MDDVRAMVQHVHKELKVQFPADDYFMNLLGVGKLAGKVPKALVEKGLAGRRTLMPCVMVLRPIMQSSGSFATQPLKLATGPQR